MSSYFFKVSFPFGAEFPVLVMGTSAYKALYTCPALERTRLKVEVSAHARRHGVWGVSSPLPPNP